MAEAAVARAGMRQLKWEALAGFGLTKKSTEAAAGLLTPHNRGSPDFLFMGEAEVKLRAVRLA